jgi:ATP/ADP translocase
MRERWFIAVSVVLFAISIGLPTGWWSADDGTLFSKWGTEMLFLGWMGPLAFQIGWYGNPLLLVSWITGALSSTRRGWMASSVIAGLALLVAGTSLLTLPLFEIFGRNEAEGATLTIPGPGIFVWLGSFLLVLAVSVVRLRRARA